MKKILYHLLLFVGMMGLAQENVVQLYDTKHVVNNPPIEYFVDKSNSLSIDNIITNKQLEFKRNFKILNLGIQTNNVWVRIYVKNHNAEYKKWILAINSPLIDSVTLYDVTNLGYKVKVLGEMIPTSEKFYNNKNIVFPFQINYQESNILYLKVKTEGLVYLPITISSEEAMFEDGRHTDFLYGLFYGATLIILVYNFILSFTVKKSTYILYCFYVIIIIGILSYFNGHISHLSFLDFNRLLLNKIFSHVVFLFTIISFLFCYHFLELHKAHRIYKVIVFSFVGLGVFFTFVSFLVSYTTSIWISAVLYTISPIVLILISIRRWLKGNRTARFYTIASFFFLTSVLLMCLRIFGFLNVGSYLEVLVDLGLVIDTIFISLALTDKLSKSEKEREEAHHLEIQDKAHKELLLKEQYQILESKVQERAKEIISKNEILEEFSMTIKQQNMLLQEYNDNLEKQIQERSAQILLTNKQLERKTERLEQFTYIVSHNLKSPIHNIDALIGLMDMDEINDENKEYLDIIRKTNNQLKSLIEEINVLVKLEKTTNLDFTWIDLSMVFDNVKNNLAMQIKQSDCEIMSDFQVINIFSFAPYINSIVYNLVSNSIKYRSKDRKLKLSFQSFIEGDNVKLIVKDNGLGISQDQIDKIFHLFYRIKSEEEGKGMGLYIVKTQIEALSGNIEVSSLQGQGSCFTISLPLNSGKND